MPVTFKPETKHLKKMRVGECGYACAILNKRNGKLGMSVFATVSSVPTNAYHAKVCRVKGGVWIDPTKTYTVFNDDVGAVAQFLDWVMGIDHMHVVNEVSVTAPIPWGSTTWTRI